MWGRTLFSHLRADHARPVVRGWQVDRILLTRSAVPRQRTSSSSGVRALCPKARPAYDGLELRLAGGGRGAAYKTDPSQLRAADAPVPHVDALTVPNWAHSGRDASVALPRLGRSPAQPPIDLLRGAAGARLGEWDSSLGEPQ
jgi:hypothetical protein